MKDDVVLFRYLIIRYFNRVIQSPALTLSALYSFNQSRNLNADCEEYFFDAIFHMLTKTIMNDHKETLLNNRKIVYTKETFSHSIYTNGKKLYETAQVNESVDIHSCNFRTYAFYSLVKSLQPSLINLLKKNHEKIISLSQQASKGANDEPARAFGEDFFELSWLEKIWINVLKFFNWLASFFKSKHEDEFCDSNNLTQIVIPEFFTKISPEAFTCSQSLRKTTITSSVVEISPWAFYGCINLSEITMPNSVNKIGSYAFSACKSLRQINIPSSVTTIGLFAFARCTSLRQITISSSVISIGYNAFADCTSLTKITITGSEVRIGRYAFSGCSNLSEITISSSVTSIYIDNDAFADCTSLRKITITGSEVRIGRCAFSGCSNLSEITISSSVTSIYIDNDAFEECNQLKAIFIDAANQEEHDHIYSLVPEKFQPFIRPYALSFEINQAKQNVIILVKPIIQHYFPKFNIDGAASIIEQYVGSLHTVINQVLLPYSQERIEGYKKELQKDLSGFRQKQQQQHFVIPKLEKIIQRAKEAIAVGKKKGPCFFNISKNQLKIDETNHRIAVATKLIKWLSDDQTISFTKDEKGYLENAKDSVATILRNHDICLDGLPEAPFHALGQGL